MFIVYHIASTMEKRSYVREHDARRLAEKLNKNGHDYGYTDADTYHNNVVHMVPRRHLMSGKTFYEPSNTPGYMSPSSETYWSM